MKDEIYKKKNKLFTTRNHNCTMYIIFKIRHCLHSISSNRKYYMLSILQVILYTVHNTYVSHQTPYLWRLLRCNLTIRTSVKQSQLILFYFLFLSMSYQELKTKLNKIRIEFDEHRIKIWIKFQPHKLHIVYSVTYSK